MKRIIAKSWEQANQAVGEWRAGGTDVTERVRSGHVHDDVIDLQIGGLDRIELQGERIFVGANVKLEDLAADTRVPPVVAKSAGGLATPAVRAMATVAGNLAQHVRCWYYRDPEMKCLRKGGPTCLARQGDHLFHACFDSGPCVAVHPSTLAVGLLAADAEIVAPDGTSQPIAAWIAAQSADLTYSQRFAVKGFTVPKRVDGETGGYFRAINRSRAEWPLVEAAVRIQFDGSVVKTAAVAIGGVSAVPIRRPAVENALVGHSMVTEGMAKACALAAEGAKPLPMTGYKVDLLGPTILSALEKAVS